MFEMLSIRLSSEDKTKLIEQAEAKGFKSTSDFARFLIGKGLDAVELRKSEHHLLSHTIQSLMLLRQLLATINPDDNSSNQIIETVKNDAFNWIDRFSKSLTS